MSVPLTKLSDKRSTRSYHSFKRELRYWRLSSSGLLCDRILLYRFQFLQISFHVSYYVSSYGQYI